MENELYMGYDSWYVSLPQGNIRITLPPYRIILATVTGMLVGLLLYWWTITINPSPALSFPELTSYANLSTLDHLGGWAWRCRKSLNTGWSQIGMKKEQINESLWLKCQANVYTTFKKQRWLAQDLWKCPYLSNVSQCELSLFLKLLVFRSV